MQLFPNKVHFNRLFRYRSIVSIMLCCICLAACGSTATVDTAITNTPTSSTTTPVTLPHYDHIVIVVEENHSASEIIGASRVPYINQLAQQGAVLTNNHGVTHPSEPNYLAMFAGSTFGLASDNCPQSFSAPNLATALSDKNLSFVGYSEDLPSVGYSGCFNNGDLYARKHNPWSNFSNVPATSSQPFTSFPTDYTQLPTVAFVIPNQVHDMHSASIGDADNWLQTNIGGYAQWATTHSSLLIVTWDEDDSSAANQVVTIFSGASIKTGQDATSVNHYDLLRTVEAITGVAFTGNASSAKTISTIWQK